MTDLEQVLRTAEDDLQSLRALIARTAAWINNPVHDHDARTALAELLGLPAPRDARKDSTPA